MNTNKIGMIPCPECKHPKPVGVKCQRCYPGPSRTPILDGICGEIEKLESRLTHCDGCNSERVDGKDCEFCGHPGPLERRPPTCQGCGRQATMTGYCAACDGVKIHHPKIPGAFLVEDKPSPVNHPPHYNTGGIEVIDAIEAWKLGFHAGNVVKYVARAGHKGDAVQDLEKARWYLDRLITSLKPKE